MANGKARKAIEDGGGGASCCWFAAAGVQPRTGEGWISVPCWGLRGGLAAVAWQRSRVEEEAWGGSGPLLLVQIWPLQFLLRLGRAGRSACGDGRRFGRGGAATAAARIWYRRPA